MSFDLFIFEVTSAITYEEARDYSWQICEGKIRPSLAGV